MKKGRKPKFITIRIYLDSEEVYINGERVLDKLKEINILDIVREDIYKTIKERW